MAKQPFTRFMQTMQALYSNSISGTLFGPVLQRIIGTDPRVIVRLYDEAELEWARRASFAEMAEEAPELRGRERRGVRWPQSVWAAARKLA